MAEVAEYRVELDPQKVLELGRVLGQGTPEKLIQSLFQLAYHYYVEEEDELIPGETLRRKTHELEAELNALRKQLAAQRADLKQATLCPKCFSAARYDNISRDYACEVCGWEGPPEEVVRRAKDA